VAFTTSQYRNTIIIYRPQLLNCQTQSHFNWLVVIPLGQKSP